MGRDFIFLAFTVVIVGGMGSITGAVVAGLLITQVQAISSLIVSPVWSDPIVFSIMVLVLVVHHDDTTGKIGKAIESALEQVLIPERDKSSPRVSGAFLFDSSAYRVTSNALKSVVLWCPSRLISMIDIDAVPAASERD